MAVENEDPWGVAETSPSEDAAPDEWGVANAGPAEEQDEWGVAETAPEWSQGGAAAAHFAKGAVPSLGGLAVGLQAGGAATLAAAPLGPAAPFVGAGVGLAAGLGAGTALSMAQDKFLALMGWDKPLEEAHKQYPLTSDIAEMAPAAGLLRPNLKSLDLAARGLGAGIGAAAEAGMQAIHGEGFDTNKILMTGAFGAALPRTNKLGDKLLASGEAVGARFKSRGSPGNADAKADLPPEEASPNILTPDESEVEVHAPVQNDTPPEAIAPANEQPRVSGGVALEQAPVAARPDTTGNEVGAPMAQRTSAAPSDPTRDYGVGREQHQPETTESKIIDNGLIPEDTRIALGAETPESAVPQPAGTDVLPREAAPTTLPEGHVPLGGEPVPAPAQHAVPEGRVPLGVDPNAIPHPEPVPAPAPEAKGPLSGDERKVYTENRRLLQEAGWNNALEALDKRVKNEAERAEFARQAVQKVYGVRAEEAGLKPSQGMAVRPSGERRMESRKTNSLGMLVEGGADMLAHHERGIKLHQDMFKDFGPSSKAGKGLEGKEFGDVKAYANKVWQEAVKRNGGKNPLAPKDTYLPTKKGHGLTEELTWMRQIRDAKGARNDEKGKSKIEALKNAHQGTGEIDANIRKLEQDIEIKPSLSERGAENRLAELNKGVEQGRVELEPWSDPKGDYSKTEGRQQQDLRNWINDLDDIEYKLLAGKHEDLAQNVYTTQDPHELLMNLQDDLQEAVAKLPRRPEKLEGPALPAKAEPVQPVGPKAKPAYETAAEEARAKTARLRAARLAKGEAEKVPLGEKTEVAGRMSDEEATAVEPHSPASVFKVLTDFANDEKGAVNAKKIVETISRLFTGAPKPIATPSGQAVETAGRRSTSEVVTGKQADAPMRAYIDSFAGSTKEDIRMTEARVLHFQDDLRKLVKNAGKEVQRLNMTERDRRRMNRAMQHGTMDKLPEEHQKLYHDYIEPMKTAHDKFYAELYDMNKKYDLKLKLPEPVKQLNIEHVPRHDEMTKIWDRSQDDMFDPFSMKSLSAYSPNLKPRSIKGLQDIGNDPNMSQLKGDRMIVDIGGDASSGFDVSVFNPGHPSFKLKNLPASFGGELGEVLEMTIKGKTSRWQLTEAATDEIEKASGGKIKYIEDPVMNWGLAAASVHKALEQAKLRVKIMNSPEFKNLVTTDMESAKERGYDPKFTRLKEIGDLKYYMPKELKWVFDDYARPGFAGDAIVDKLRAFNQAVAKFINVNAPFVHVINEAVQIAVARGYRWVWPPSYYRIARLLPEAIRSVNEQDALQREMRFNSAHPQLAATLARSTFHDYGSMVGMDMTINAAQWDPIAKMYNMTTPQLMDKIYQASSDVTWRLSDYMATAHYLELKAEGYTGKQAAAKLNKFFSTYQVGTTIFGKRGLQQFLVDPATALFGRYKANIFQSFYHIGNDIATGSPALKAEAFSQALVLGAIGIFGFSMINKGLEKLTGIEGIELRPRGMAAQLNAAYEVATGKKSLAAAASQIVSPAPGLQMAGDLMHNKDYSGKDIFPQGNWFEDPTIPVEGAGRVAEYAARSLVPPYSGMSQNYARDDEGGGPLGALRGFGLEQFGISAPSDKALNYREKTDQYNRRAQKTRNKRSQGVIPDAVKALTDW